MDLVNLFAQLYAQLVARQQSVADVYQAVFCHQVHVLPVRLDVKRVHQVVSA